MHSDAAERYLSQSEVSDWNTCPLRAHARWILNHRPPDDESRAQRIGTMGHAIFADRIASECEHREPDADAAVAVEAERRGWKWGDESLDEQDLAATAVDLLATSEDVVTWPDAIVRHGGDLLVEKRLRAAWPRVFEVSSMLRRDVERCLAIMKRFMGMEGQFDLVTEQDDVGVIYDYKFRQSPDLGGAATAEESRLPDRQFSWYSVLLWAAGFRPRGGFEARQVNVYAGRWLDVVDFMDAANGRAESAEMAALVTSSGLPTIDPNRYRKAGGWVTSGTWAEAHRLLAEDRLSRRLAEWRQRPATTATGRARKPVPPPDRLSYAEQADANRFIADLEVFRPVVSRRFRADLSVCAEVVRDMIVSVDGPLSQSLRGMTPARVLQTYPRSSCVRPYGCSYQGPCHASLGSGRVLEVLAEQRAQAERSDAPDPRRLPVLGHGGPPLPIEHPSRAGQWHGHDNEDNATLSVCDVEAAED